MDQRDIYARQVKLLMTALPHVAKESCFALKGGTAINLFVQDFPRLSVDIDLVYKTFMDRDTDLAAIDDALRRITESLNSTRGSPQFGRIIKPMKNALSLTPLMRR